MAQLSRRYSRGQILLVGAIALAVLFIGLAVITNSAIYTQSLASREATSGTNDALQMRHEVQQNTGSVVERVNWQFEAYEANGSTTPLDQLKAHIADYQDSRGYLAAGNSRAVTATYVTDDDGTRINDTEPGGSDFTAENSLGPIVETNHWAVAKSVGEIRSFELEFDRSTVTDDSLGSNWQDEFIINVTKYEVTALTGLKSEVWQIHVGESGGTATVKVIRGDNDPVSTADPATVVGTCSAGGSSDTFTVDVTEGTVAGEPCEPLDDIWNGPNSIGSSFYVTYDQSGLVEGNYSMVINDGSPGAGVGGPGDRSTADPVALDAFYSVTVQYRYESPTLTYQTDVRVAPGEPDD